MEVYLVKIKFELMLSSIMFIIFNSIIVLLYSIYYYYKATNKF